MSNWRPVDYIVAFLTLMVGMLFMGLVAEPLMLDEQKDRTEEENRLTANIIQSVISIITLYVGAAIQKKADEEDLLKQRKMNDE